MRFSCGSRNAAPRMGAKPPTPAARSSNRVRPRTSSQQYLDEGAVVRRRKTLAACDRHRAGTERRRLLYRAGTACLQGVELSTHGARGSSRSGHSLLHSHGAGTRFFTVESSYSTTAASSSSPSSAAQCAALLTDIAVARSEIWFAGNGVRCNKGAEDVEREKRKGRGGNTRHVPRPRPSSVLRSWSDIRPRGPRPHFRRSEP